MSPCARSAHLKHVLLLPLEAREHIINARMTFCFSLHVQFTQSFSRYRAHGTVLFCLPVRVSDQNGVSLLYIMLEMHHSGREPSNDFAPSIPVMTACKLLRQIHFACCRDVKQPRNKLSNSHQYHINRVSPCEAHVGSAVGHGFCCCCC